MKTFPPNACDEVCPHFDSYQNKVVGEMDFAQSSWLFGPTKEVVKNQKKEFAEAEMVLWTRSLD